MMNWDAIGAIAEVTGSIAVVVSLIYVALQIRQNTEQSKLASAHAVDTSNMLAFDPIYTPENSAIWTKGHADPEALSDHERHIFDMLMTRVLVTSFNTSSYHHARGMFEEELYKPIVDYFSTLVTSPGGELWYSTHARFLHPEARVQLEQGVARANADSNRELHHNVVPEAFE